MTRHDGRRPDELRPLEVDPDYLEQPHGSVLYGQGKTIVLCTATVEEGDHGTERAEVVLLDCSGSMGRPWSKLRAARRATGEVLDALPDGTWFAVVRCDHRAATVYPHGAHLVLSRHG